MHVVTLLPTAASLFSVVPAGARALIAAVSASLLIAAVACGLAMLLVVRAGGRYEARALALFLVLVAVCWGSVLRFASWEHGPDGAPIGLDITVGGVPLLLAILTMALASAALLGLSVRFPTDLASGEGAGFLGRRPWMPWVLAMATPLLLQPGVSLIAMGARAVGVDVETMSRLFALLLWTFGVLIAGSVVGMLGLAVFYFVRGYRLADEQARRSAMWLLVGVVGSALLMLTSALLLALDIVLPISLGLLSRYTPLVVLFSPLVMVVCVAVALLYSGAVDPRLALRRSTINGIAGTMGLLVFAGLENALSSWVEGRLGLPGMVGSFLAGGASAAVFLPIQRILARSRGGPQAALGSRAPAS